MNEHDDGRVSSEILASENALLKQVMRSYLHDTHHYLHDLSWSLMHLKEQYPDERLQFPEEIGKTFGLLKSIDRLSSNMQRIVSEGPIVDLDLSEFIEILQVPYFGGSPLDVASVRNAVRIRVHRSTLTMVFFVLLRFIPYSNRKIEIAVNGDRLEVNGSLEFSHFDHYPNLILYIENLLHTMDGKIFIARSSSRKGNIHFMVTLQTA